MTSRAFRIQWSDPRTEKPRAFFSSRISLVFLSLLSSLPQSSFLASFAFLSVRAHRTPFRLAIIIALV